jgi:hypothetical protein
MPDERPQPSEYEQLVTSLPPLLVKHIDGPAASAAYDLIFLGIDALVGRDPKARQTIEKIEAFWRGFDGPTSDALKLTRAASAIGLAVSLHTMRNAPDIDVSDRETWAGRLLQGMVAQHLGIEAQRMPSAKILSSWLAKYSPHRARGKLTKAGILTEILLVTRSNGITKTTNRTAILQRVDKALKTRPPR